MSIDELPPAVAHQRELEAWEDRSIPGRELSTRDLMRRQKADDIEAQRLKYEERELCENEAAVEAHWTGVMAAQPDWMRNVTYNARPGVDRRCFG